MSGDFSAADEDGSWYLLGRSDHTIKVAGKQIDPSEIEAAVSTYESVKEAAAIGIPHDIKGAVPVVFAVLQKNIVSSSLFAEGIQERAELALGKGLKPQHVFISSELPYTQSGKIARRVIRTAYLR